MNNIRKIIEFFSFKKGKKFKKIPLFTLLDGLNGNKLFVGMMMIFMNIGSRYIDLGLTEGQQKILKYVAREILIFTIAFINTRNILISLIITIIFSILVNFIFNEKCKYNLLPKKTKEFIEKIDLDGDGVISDEEINKALKVLKKAKEKNNQNNLNSGNNNINYNDNLKAINRLHLNIN